MTLSRSTFPILCAFVLASCGGGVNLPEDSRRTGLHIFDVTCTGQLILRVKVAGRGINDALERHKRRANKSFCDVVGYVDFIEGSELALTEAEEAEFQQKLELELAQEKILKEREEKLEAERIAQTRAELKRRRLAMEDACESYGFQKGTDQFPNCIKDLNIAMQNAKREERLAREMRQEVARQAGLDREKQQEVADQARWNAIFSTVVQAGVATANTNAQIRNNNMNTNSIISNQNMNTQRLIRGR